MKTHWRGRELGSNKKRMGSVNSLPELLATLALNFTRRWKTCSSILSSTLTQSHPGILTRTEWYACTHSQHDHTHTCTHAHTFTHPPAILTTPIVLLRASTSIWIPYEEPGPTVKTTALQLQSVWLYTSPAWVLLRCQDQGTTRGNLTFTTTLYRMAHRCRSRYSGWCHMWSSSLRVKSCGCIRKLRRC